MSKPIELSLEAEVIFSGTVTKGFRGSHNSPPEPAEAEDVCAIISVLGQKIDITDLLNKATLNEMAVLIMEEKSDCDEYAKECAAEDREEARRERG